VLFSSGNSAIVFRIRHEGKIKALRCYRHPTAHLREVYGERLLREELFLYDTPRSGRWVDVVVTDWIEGETLRHHIEEAAQAGDTTYFRRLAEAFDRLAARLIADDWAHGDLKPDNMVITTEGELRLIDFDAIVSPRLEGLACEELGALKYQHPQRGLMQCKAIDDYPIALIATALHAMAADVTLVERYSIQDMILVEPQDAVAGRDVALEEIERLFAHRGDAVHYRMARLLRSQSVALPELGELLSYSIAEPLENDSPLELDCKAGHWGYRTGSQWIVPPLYDEGFEFSEGVAAVRLCDVWHFIDLRGRVCFSCEGCERIKPFRNGRAIKVVAGKRIEIDHSGREL
jgi:serine/threonine protein kinase